MAQDLSSGIWKDGMGRFEAPGALQLYLPSLSLHTEQAAELPGEIFMLRALPQRKKRVFLLF